MHFLCTVEKLYKSRCMSCIYAKYLIFVLLPVRCKIYIMYYVWIIGENAKESKNFYLALYYSLVDGGNYEVCKWWIDFLIKNNYGKV